MDVSETATTFQAHRGGEATVTPAGGSAAAVAANQQAKLVGTDSPRVEIAAAPGLSAWDRWNYQRTDYLIQPASAQHVGAGVYGAEELDRHGTWRTVETYGSVWVPSSVAPGWGPTARAAGSGIRTTAGPGSTTRRGAGRRITTAAGCT